MRNRLLHSLFSFAIIVSVTGCAYRWGQDRRNLPGGYSQVAVPMFVNRTKEVGIETYFTNELIREFERSKVAKVVDRSTAPIHVDGEIVKVEYQSLGRVRGDEDKGLQNLPAETVLTTDYRVIVYISITLRMSSNKSVAWQGAFKDEIRYSAPLVQLPTLNSVDPLYNHSARHQNMQLLAKEMMSDAHDRITEQF